MATARVIIPLTPVPASPPIAPAHLPPGTPARRPRKAFARRPAGREQLLRQSVQIAFLLLNLWIGLRFYLFVRYYETTGQTVYVPRPAGVDGWLPIAALMNLKVWLFTGELPSLHPAGFFLLVAFVSASLLARKAFCSWLCPIGTVSEWLWRGGEEIFGRTWTPWRWIDVPLRGLKYILLGLFAYAVASMSTDGIRAFLQSPYGVIADVKMLNFFRHLSTVGASVLAGLVVLSLFVRNAWCRYLCPYGALMGLVALASPARIRRDADRCIDCAKCAKACPARLPVDRVTTVRSAECSACLLCVSACPAAGALDLSVGRRALPAWSVAAVVLGTFLAAYGIARATGHWDTLVADATYFELVPNADVYSHPGR